VTADAPPGARDVASRIVAWLRAADGPLSGAEIARRLGCTRAAVWKHVDALRQQGYAIAARPASGYELLETPDRLSLAELGPHLRGSWRRIEWHEELDSTQRVARDLARAGAAEGTVVIAETQTAGRGRLGRRWHSPPGVNFYGSIVLRPELPLTAVPQIALVAGLAAADAIAAETGLRPGLKWPNDVQLGGKKVVGILTEMEAEVERVLHVIAGIGVNVNAPAQAFPPELRATASSLALESGRRIERAAFVGRLLAVFEARYERLLAVGFAAMRRDWDSYCALTGRTVQVTAPGGIVAGRVRGVADDGALVVEEAPAALHRIVAGEVTLRPDAGGRPRP
jgi:BirA family biotin operon repressor/biotin-[acetyl-CoA-carboxylase] ligase